MQKVMRDVEEFTPLAGVRKGVIFSSEIQSRRRINSFYPIGYQHNLQELCRNL
jgi:hypothetical protein